MAWYALHDALDGEEREVVAWAADTIAGKLAALGPGVANPLPPNEAAAAIKEAQMFSELMAEIFGQSDLPAGDEARLAFKADLRRVRRGALNKANPVLPSGLGWWGHAAEAEAHMATGDSQKIAVGKVAATLGVRDAVVAEWVRDRRKALAAAQARFGDLDN